MFQTGQTVSTRGGRTVQIVAVLAQPDSHGDCIVGLYHSGDGVTEIMTWGARGAFSPQHRTSLDLVAQVETKA